MREKVLSLGEGRVMLEAEVGVTHLEAGGRGHRPRNSGDFNSVRLILDFQPPELKEDSLILF